MDIPREVAILDECSTLCMRKRKSLISKYRSFERVPRLLAFASAGFAMLAGLLMAATTYSGLPPSVATLSASLIAAFAGLLAVSSVAFFSTGQLVDAVEGAASFLSLNNRCQIERERGIARGEISFEAIKNVISDFNSLSSRYDRLMPMTVGNLSLPRAVDLPEIRLQNTAAQLSSTGDRDEDGFSEAVLEQIDQIIDDIKSSEGGNDDPEKLADIEERRRKISTVS